MSDVNPNETPRQRLERMRREHLEETGQVPKSDAPKSSAAAPQPADEERRAAKRARRAELMAELDALEQD